MGFTSPQFDFIDQRFTHRRIKTLDVICSEEVQAVSDDPTLVTTVPSEVAMIIGPDGQLQPGVQIVITDIDPGASVTVNKVCNIFIVSWVILDAAGNRISPSVGTFTSTISDAVDCPGAGVGPSQTVVQKHDIQVHFCLVPFDTDGDGTFDRLEAIVDVEYCLIVANEVILKINAARPFCP